MTIIYKVKEHRKKLGLSLRELASKAEVSKSEIFNIENGKCDPTLYVMCKIATALEIDVRELFDYF